MVLIKMVPKPWLFIAVLALTVGITTAEEAKKIYIVRMDESTVPTVFPTHEHWYKSLLSSIIDDVETNLIYTYDHAMHGFSARLTKAEVDTVAGAPGHLATYESRRLHLQTTRTPRFMGLSRTSGIWPRSGFGNDVIVGLVDTGIWPESESFNDRGLTDVPTRWKGSCQAGEAFNSSNCNKKLIGAHYFLGLTADGAIAPSPNGEYASPRDSQGHGTHTASTAVGRFVPNAEYFGYAKGTAAGVAPGARLAVYKVCYYWCVSSNIIAGIDQALKDGVDILSLSIGGNSPEDFVEDILAQAAFAAIDRGVLPVFAGGNDGSSPGTVVNVAPWAITVGASSIDRQFLAEVTLGNGNVIKGNSYYAFDEPLFNVPITYITQSEGTQACKTNSLRSKLVAGKIVLCTSDKNETLYTDFKSVTTQMEKQLQEANRTGATAVIMVNDHYPNLFPQMYLMPALVVGPAEGKILSTYASTSTATADILFHITSVGTKPAPVVAEFSSRGPAVFSQGILKPDIVAPGVDILAAYPPNIQFVSIGDKGLASDYVLDSGTSMATPHVSGAAALVKGVHPSWSPAFIQSALMTTAYTGDNSGHPYHTMTQQNGFNRIPIKASPLDFGSGHVRPNLAVDPGLVYDAGVNDYLDFLCAMNYTAKQIQIITGKKYSCRPDLSTTDLNYPSFSAVFNKNMTDKQVITFHRTVTNVGGGESVYRVELKAPPGVNVRVEPNVLKFGSVNQKLNYVVTMEMQVKKTMVTQNFVWYGFLTWVDRNRHRVQSPLVAFLSS